MKINSPLFDRIRVKPPENERPRKAVRACEWPGCKEEATHRAPKGRNEGPAHWHYCLAHVREYNQSYNFFAGMSDDAVLKFQKDAITGHRPTWKMGTGKKGAEQTFSGAGDPFGMFHEFGAGRARPQAKPSEGRTIRNAERKAFGVLGLEFSATGTEIKARFHELVKRHHPDANGGDRSSEDRLIEIIQSYNYLKSVGFC